MFKTDFCAVCILVRVVRVRDGSRVSCKSTDPTKSMPMDECSRHATVTSTDMTYTVYGVPVRGTACAAVYGCRVGIDNLYSKVKEFVRVESALCVVYQCSLCTSRMRSAPAKKLHCTIIVLLVQEAKAAACV